MPGRRGRLTQVELATNAHGDLPARPEGTKVLCPQESLERRIYQNINLKIATKICFEPQITDNIALVFQTKIKIKLSILSSRADQKQTSKDCQICVIKNYSTRSAIKYILLHGNQHYSKDLNWI